LFTLNTFSVTEYIRAIEARGHAVALEMGFSRFLSILYDFYWRIYDTHIPKKRTLQNVTYQVADWKRLQILIQLGKVTGMLAEHPDSYSLTRRGAFWVHLLQNYFSLRYINTIWTAAKRKPWPASIQF
jgi:menaquinone C8-methyltransferase